RLNPWFIKWKDGGSMADPCIKARNKVAVSAEKVADLKGLVDGATGAALHGLAGQLTQAANQLIRDQKALAACEGAHPPPPPPAPSAPPAPRGGNPPPAHPTSDPCIDKRKAVQTAQEKVAELKGLIDGATGAVLHGLAGRLAQAL